MAKYKFILTLPDDYEVDSALAIEGHMAWPNYSQAEPVFYKGIFDSYEEAEKCAAEFSIYKFSDRYGYDSFYSEEDPRFYVSIFDAEDAAAAACGVEPGDMIYPNPDDFTVEEAECDGETVYKYCLFYNGECVYDSLEQDDLVFGAREDAEEEARSECETFEVEDAGELPYELEEVEILAIRIEEVTDFIIIDGTLCKYLGTDTEVVIPEGVVVIDDEVFKKRSDITRVEIPESVIAIYGGAFSYCSGLKSIKLPAKLQDMGRECFYGCTGLTSVVIPEGLPYISVGCFSRCTALQSVTIPGTVKRICDLAFSDCENLADIQIPSGVQTIGAYAFRNCKSLAELELPGTMKALHQSAFAYCTGLRKMKIPKTVKEIMGDFVFGNCDMLVIETVKGSTAEEYARKHEIAVKAIDPKKKQGAKRDEKR